MAIDLGRVLLIPKGEWSSTTAYTKLDLVSYQGSSYVCTVANTNQVPTNTSYWQLSAQKGRDGVNGKDGVQGPKGDTGATGAKGEPGPKGLMPTVNYNNADLNVLLGMQSYGLPNDSSHYSNLPPDASTPGQVVNLQVDDRCIQLFACSKGVYMRWTNNKGLSWSPWQSPGGSSQQINTDTINKYSDVKTTGYYYLGSVFAPQGNPNDSGTGILEVIAGYDYGIQRLTVLESGAIWQRAWHNSNTFTAWTKLT